MDPGQIEMGRATEAGVSHPIVRSIQKSVQTLLGKNELGAFLQAKQLERFVNKHPYDELIAQIVGRSAAPEDVVTWLNRQEYSHMLADDIKLIHEELAKRGKFRDAHILILFRDPALNSISRVLLFLNTKSHQEAEAAAIPQNTESIGTKIRNKFRRDTISINQSPIPNEENDSGWRLFLFTPDGGCGIKTFDSVFEHDKVHPIGDLYLQYYAISPTMIAQAQRLTTLFENSYVASDGLLHQTGWEAKGVNREGSLNWLVSACLGDIPNAETTQIPMKLVDPHIDIASEIKLLPDEK